MNKIKEISKLFRYEVLLMFCVFMVDSILTFKTKTNGISAAKAVFVYLVLNLGVLASAVRKLSEFNYFYRAGLFNYHAYLFFTSIFTSGLISVSLLLCYVSNYGAFHESILRHLALAMYLLITSNLFIIFNFFINKIVLSFALLLIIAVIDFVIPVVTPIQISLVRSAMMTTEWKNLLKYCLFCWLVFCMHIPSHYFLLERDFINETN